MRGDRGGEGYKVISDAHRIQQIVNNLISNAIKYTDHGHVHVRVRCIDKSNPELMILVTDTGIGIRAECLPNLFNPFMQIDQGNTRRHEGAGMGLAIVKRLVELFRGEINVNSELNYGTRFEVRIPVKPVITKTQDDNHVDVSNQSADKILIVDDHVDIRNSFTEILEQMGYCGDAVESGKGALEKIERTKYAAVLLDIQMPEMDGFAVAAAIRRKPGPNQQIPIIAISAYPMDFGGVQHSQSFHDYLLKPVRSDALSAVLKKLIS